MKIFNSFQDWTIQDKLVATLGTFDGVHLGHQFILNDLKKHAKNQNAKSLVISLNPHPRIVLGQAKNLKLIQTLQEKIQSIQNQEIDYLFLLPFDLQIANLSAETFLKEIIFGRLQIDVLLIGYDHRLGKNREGNFEFIQAIGKQLHKQVIKLSEFKYGEQKISSTIIRNYILEGYIKKANELLGHTFTLTGKVIEGDKRGRLLGFPTANIFVDDPYKIIPKNGVYICKVISNQQSYFGVTNIGNRPTFNTMKHQVEVHILDFSQDIYNQYLTLEFLEYVRPEQKFESIDQLKQQIHRDVVSTREFFKLKTL